MEHPIIVGILDIVEEKLREFDIRIPDAYREDSTDPIVGYQYAQLHDQLKEFLKGRLGLDNPLKFYGITVVNSQGYITGRESDVCLTTTLRECMEKAYEKYTAIWKSLSEDGQLMAGKDTNGTEFLPCTVFETELLRDGYFCIQLEGYHIQMEYFEKELERVPERVYAEKICEIKEEYFREDIIMSELLRSHNELTVREKRELLAWAGEEDYVKVLEDGSILPIHEKLSVDTIIKRAKENPCEGRGQFRESNKVIRR